MATLYAVYQDALVVVHNTGGEPTVREFEMDSRPECVVADDGPILVGTFEHGLQRSTDGGNSWERAAGIEADAVTAVTFSPDDADTVYAGTEPSRVYRSTDGGRTFERLDGLLDLPSADEWSFPPRPETHHVRWIEPDPNDPDLLHVAIEAGALVRARLDADDGVEWKRRVPESRRDVHTITTQTDAPGNAWVAAGDGYGETANGGDSWRRPQAGLEHTYCWSVAVSSSRAKPGLTSPQVLLSAATGADAAHRRGESYLYRRGAGRWERLDDPGIPTGDGVFRTVLTTTDGGEVVWAANNHGLYRTADGGDSWHPLDIPWPARFESQLCRGLAVLD